MFGLLVAIRVANFQTCRRFQDYQQSLQARPYTIHCHSAFALLRGYCSDYLA